MCVLKCDRCKLCVTLFSIFLDIFIITVVFIRYFVDFHAYVCTCFCLVVFFVLS